MRICSAYLKSFHPRYLCRRSMTACGPEPGPTKLVCVLGATGTGKSKLAIDLALALRDKPLEHASSAEVINADALQVYKALPVLTAKVSEEEMQGVPHHLMSFLDPAKSEEYHVNDFVKDASSLIRSLSAEQKLPIIVGGTTYYVQHLLAPPKPYEYSESARLSVAALQAALPTSELVALSTILPQLPMISSPSSLPEDFPLEKLPLGFRSAETLAYAMWQLLDVCDRKTASKWHWRDVRKVRRQIELIVPEMSRKSEATSPPSLHSSHCKSLESLVFWLHTEPETLRLRLDTRVDKMIEKGVLEEVQYIASLTTSTTDYSRGITQAIGFRPFAEYLRWQESNEKDLKAASDVAKINTRQYVKKQLSWFKHKFVPAVSDGEHRIHVYVLDNTKADSDWPDIANKAEEIVRSFLQDDDLPLPDNVSESARDLLQAPEKVTRPKKVQCKICTVDTTKPVMISEGAEQTAHERSKRHLAFARRAKGKLAQPKTKT